MDEMWMMTPERCFSIEGSSPRSRRTAANKFASMAFCQSSSLRASAPPDGADEPPTLLTRISIPSRHSNVAVTTLLTPSAVLISAWPDKTPAFRFAGGGHGGGTHFALPLVRPLAIQYP